MTDLTKHRIIVVEDEPATRKLLAMQLERAGYEVAAFGDGRAALEPVTAMGTGIVLADWSMPEMDGIELCRAVRGLEEMGALSNIYFILLTAHDSKEQTIEGLEAGANDYLTKPYHQGELLARLQVGERMLRLQAELIQRNIEYQKANAQLAILTRKLEELANTDVLTGLANRRALFDRFEEIWELASRNGHAVSGIMFDIDRFKSINDTYGHDAGDQVLREVAEIARRSVRRPDLCGRIGGEEFVILCPATHLDGAAILAERVRTSVAEHVVVCNDVTISTSISCGVAERLFQMERPDELLKLADAMLYAAKEHGRNQTWVAQADGTGHVIEEVALDEPNAHA